MSFLLVRPQSKLEQSVQYFASRGLAAKGLAAIIIESIDDSALVNRFLALDLDIVILTSTYSANWFAKLAKQYSQPRLEKLNVICVGNSTAKALDTLSAKLNIEIAEPENSEGVIALDSLHNIDGKNVAIVKGLNGRTLIQETLIQRNAITTEFNVYKRIANLSALQAFAFEQNQIKCIISASNEIIDVLFDNYDPIHLTRLPWIVASQRIKDYAVSKGISQVFVSKGASIEALSNSALDLVRTGVVND